VVANFLDTQIALVEADEGIAGTFGGFRYSRAMKGTSLTWDDKTLDAFLADPQKVVPGNVMPFSGERENETGRGRMGVALPVDVGDHGLRDSDAAADMNRLALGPHGAHFVVQ
jgi:hypothetical protein